LPLTISMMFESHSWGGCAKGVQVAPETGYCNDRHPEPRVLAHSATDWARSSSRRRLTKKERHDFAVVAGQGVGSGSRREFFALSTGLTPAPAGSGAKPEGFKAREDSGEGSFVLGSRAALGTVARTK